VKPKVHNKSIPDLVTQKFSFPSTELPTLKLYVHYLEISFEPVTMSSSLEQLKATGTVCFDPAFPAFAGDLCTD
jgi:hypothetical protein